MLPQSMISFLFIASAYVFNIMCIVSSCSLEAGFNTRSYTCDEPLDWHARSLNSIVVANLPQKKHMSLQAKLDKEKVFTACFIEVKGLQLLDNYKFL
ncbi:MAG: hypothetical protein HAW62_04430 [Endozoicomonadaceae bacterium]|nr:hypothetical protein [Endozoicomonadaceae bacterium]